MEDGLVLLTFLLLKLLLPLLDFSFERSVGVFKDAYLLSSFIPLLGKLDNSSLDLYDCSVAFVAHHLAPSFFSSC